MPKPPHANKVLTPPHAHSVLTPSHAHSVLKPPDSHSSANNHVQPGRVRSHSVSTSYPRQATAGTNNCQSCEKKLACRTSLMLQSGRVQLARAASNSGSGDKTFVVYCDEHQTKPKAKLSTESFRSRVSSVSSSTSASSGSSFNSSLSSKSSINTVVFWNQYRRQPEDSLLKNMLKRAKIRRCISRDRKYLSCQELYLSKIN